VKIPTARKLWVSFFDIQAIQTPGDGYWRFNLKVSNYSVPGEYLVTVISGDESEYSIGPACVSSFLVQ
jgi:hypothetical protein